MALRKDAKERHTALCALIQQNVENEGQEFEGHDWAVLPLQVWAEMLGVTSTKTISRLIRHEPIHFTKTMVEGVPAVLLRVGEKGKQTPREMANIMATIFRKQTGVETVSKRLWGMMYGLAENLPDGYEIAIFKHLISKKGWESFMAALGLHIALLTEAEGVKGHVKRFYRFPSIPVLRRYWKVAADAYKSDMQALNMKNDPDYDWLTGT